MKDLTATGACLLWGAFPIVGSVFGAGIVLWLTGDKTIAAMAAIVGGLLGLGTFGAIVQLLKHLEDRGML